LPSPVAPDEPILEPQPLPAPDDDSAPDPLRVQVQRVEVLGSTVFSEAELAAVVQPYEGRSLSLEELRGIADDITLLYLEQGFLTSRAVLVDQVITEGEVQIRVIEGSLERIEIEGNRRVSDRYIRSRVTLGANVPLNQGELEDQLRLLRLDPLFENVEASLRAGEGLGQSILIVRVTEADPVFGRVSVDNFSTPSVGSERLGLELGLRSPTGLGDELSATYRRTTTGGSNAYDLRYRLPLNPLEGTLELRAAPSDYRLSVGGFSVEGDTELYEVSLRQPLRRSPQGEFALSLGLTYRDGEAVIGDVFRTGSTTSVIKFGQELIQRDVAGAWAVRSQFSLGTRWFGATAQGSPDGQFLSWLGQVQRVQLLNPNNLLIMQVDVQLSPDPLLASEQFAIGGGQSLRGFRQNARLGDNGLRASVENRITLSRNEAGAPVLQLAPFLDLGTVWNNSRNPTSTPSQPFLAGTGVGLLWQPDPQLNLRLDAALPLVDVGDRTQNAQDEAVYFSVDYRF
jgi:hemolysin activation/secretion protein